MLKTFESFFYFTEYFQYLKYFVIIKQILFPSKLITKIIAFMNRKV